MAILAELGAPAPVAVTRVTGGWDTAIWRVETAGQPAALRVFRTEQLETCRREAAAMRMLTAAGLPVPSVHAQGIGQGRPALLMAWCAGRPLLHEVRARPWAIWGLGVAMGRMHARIHQVPVPPEGAAALPATWRPREDDADPPLRARLRAVARGQPALLHLDYHPLNVMAAGWRVTGVLDWANVAVGDRRVDLARTVALLQLAPFPPDAPVALLSVLRRVLETAWRTGYQRTHGSNPFVDMAPFYAWAGGMMARDLTPKLGRAGVWLAEHDLVRMRAWARMWQRRARVDIQA